MPDKTLKASDLDWGLIVQLGAVGLVAVILALGALVQAIFGVNGFLWASGAVVALAGLLGFAGLALSASV